MRIIQLLNVDGEYANLYLTNRTDSFENIEKDIQEAYYVAKAREEHYAENDYEECIYIHDEADEYLEKRGIKRVYVDVVRTDVF